MHYNSDVDVARSIAMGLRDLEVYGIADIPFSGFTSGLEISRFVSLLRRKTKEVLGEKLKIEFKEDTFGGRRTSVVIKATIC